MTLSQRFISFSMLGTMALALAPVVGAQGFGGNGGPRGHGPIGFGADIDDDTRTEIREELKECRDENDGDREAMKACADAIFDSYGIERPERPERGEKGDKGERLKELFPEVAHDALDACFESDDPRSCVQDLAETYGVELPERPERGEHQNIPEEARQELKDCRDENDGDREAMKACAEEVAEEYGFDLPKPGARIGHKFRSSIEEACGERDDSDAWKECAKEARSDVRGEFQENHPGAFNRFQTRRGLIHSADLRDELRACLELDDTEELRECVFGVRQQARENAQN